MNNTTLRIKFRKDTGLFPMYTKTPSGSKYYYTTFNQYNRNLPYFYNMHGEYTPEYAKWLEEKINLPIDKLRKLFRNQWGFYGTGSSIPCFDQKETYNVIYREWLEDYAIDNPDLLNNL